MKNILSRIFYHRSTVQVAKDLLGKKIVRQVDDQILSGIIVETEAYTYNDPACHAFRGKTKSNRALFEEVGHTYIYFIYGNHWCLNVVARDRSQCAGGVLIRALEPVDGIELMKKNRKQSNIKNLTNGPGKLTQALDVNKNLYGIDVTQKGELYLTWGIHIDQSQICSSSRVGISKAREKHWRFYICDNPFVSKR